MTMRMKMWGIVCVLILATGASFGQNQQSNDASARTTAQSEPNDGRHYQVAQAGVQTQFTYVDVGVNLDFNRARLEGDRIFLLITAEISSADSAASDSGLHQPIIRQNKWNSGVTIPLGKPTVIFSSDDVSSKRTMQVELTVTPVR